MQPLRSVYNAGFSKLFVNYIGLVYKTEVGDIVPEDILNGEYGGDPVRVGTV